MKKIIAGIIGTLLTVGITGGAAYALLSSQATVSGISIDAGTASLLVGSHGGSLGSDFPTALTLSHVFPGYTASSSFDVRNASDTAINLAVTGQLTSATGWPNLQNAVQVDVDDGATHTGWMSLALWNATPVAFPGAPIAQNTTVTYNVHVRVPLVYEDGGMTGSPVGNEISGMSLTNVTFTLTGTQTP